MFILDFKSSRQQAFARGFLKDFACPAMLYHREDVSTIPPFEEIKAPSYVIADALAGDWVRIGTDRAKMIEKNGKVTEQKAK